MTIERKDSRNHDKPRHYCRNLHCRSKLKAPVENERDAFCTRGCFEIFYRTRCRVCERRLDANPMTGGKRVADGRRRFCGRKCASKAPIDPRGYRDSPPRKRRARSAHLAGLKSGDRGDRARISTPAHVIAAEVWGGRDWQPAISSDGIEIEISRVRPRALVDCNRGVP